MTWLLALCIPALVLMFVFMLLSFNKGRNKTFRHQSPKVAVLLAARNEQENILDCLESLANLSYDKGRLQILIGDDNSEDKTGVIIRDFVSDQHHMEYFLISEKQYGLQAKANVLEQLADKTDAEFLFITDADIEVPTHWIQNMLKQFDHDTGVVTGVTAIKSGNSFLALMQNLDWLFALGLAHFLSLVNFPVTCMGNNMAIRKKAFNEVGGYKKIGFSVTEDFHLFRALLDNRWGFKNLYSKGVLAYSQPMKSWRKLLKQRQRWMRGALTYSIVKTIPLLVFPIFYIGVVGMFFLNWKLSLLSLTFMLMMKMVLAANAFTKIEKRNLVLHFWMYELYCLLIMLSMVLYYPFSGKVSWKERKL